MNQPDLRFLKAVRQANDERERRLRAERQASALKAQNDRLRWTVKKLTIDAAVARGKQAGPPATDKANLASTTEPALSRGRSCLGS
jgi:hypothetical protein